jgi:hypothetical protein
VLGAIDVLMALAGLRRLGGDDAGGEQDHAAESEDGY